MDAHMEGLEEKTQAWGRGQCPRKDLEGRPRKEGRLKSQTP